MIDIAFLGAGRMASAMVNGLLAKKLYAPDQLACTSAPDGTGEALAGSTSIGFRANLTSLLQESAIVVIACKPQQLKEIDQTVSDLTAGKLIISILAGTPLNKLKDRFPKAGNIVRAMPNTPGQIGAGITCYASLNHLEDADREDVEKILGSMGQVIPLDEEYLDAVTAVSGSGPAYVFEFVAALRDGGIAAGLESEVAYKLALETTLGAARLLASTGESPENLRDRVTSPGGTTMAALEVLNEREFRNILADAVEAARKRSIEMAQS